MLDGSMTYVRRLEEEDLPLRVTWLNSPDISLSLRFELPVSLARTRQWFLRTVSDDTRVDLSIVHRASGRVVGMAGLLAIDRSNRCTELYITVGDAKFRGCGIASEVVPLIVGYAFAEHGLNRVYLHSLGSNERARRLYERLGFVPEGQLREHCYCHGRFEDVWVHGLLRSEWPGLPGTARAPSAR